MSRVLQFPRSPNYLESAILYIGTILSMRSHILLELTRQLKTFGFGSNAWFWLKTDFENLEVNNYLEIVKVSYEEDLRKFYVHTWNASRFPFRILRLFRRPWFLQSYYRKMEVSDFEISQKHTCTSFPLDFTPVFEGLQDPLWGNNFP